MGIKELYEEVKIRLSSKSLPKHIAIAIDGCKEYSEKNSIAMQDVCSTKILHIKNIIKTAAKLNIPIISFHFSAKQTEEELDALHTLFTDLLNWDFINENQIKISVLGKWYSLPERFIDPIKSVLESTKDYDKFFINLCINYDGQEEIVDACRLIARQVKLSKIDPDSIDKALIKENIYASYFLPPDLLIKTGTGKSLGGFLLWDSANSKIFFSEKLWPDFGRDDFLRAIEWCQEN